MWETEEFLRVYLCLQPAYLQHVYLTKIEKDSGPLEDLLVSGHDNHTGAERLDSAEVSFRMIDMDDMTATGAVTIAWSDNSPVYGIMRNKR